MDEKPTNKVVQKWIELKMILMKVVLKSFSEKFCDNFTPKIDPEFWKCPIFNGSVENFGNSLGKNKYIGLISDQIWSSSWMPKFLKQS